VPVAELEAAHALRSVVPSDKALKLLSVHSCHIEMSSPSPVTPLSSPTPVQMFTKTDTLTLHSTILTTVVSAHSLMDPTVTAFVPQSSSVGAAPSGNLFLLMPTTPQTLHTSIAGSYTFLGTDILVHPTPYSTAVPVVSLASSGAHSSAHSVDSLYKSYSEL